MSDSVTVTLTRAEYEATIAALYEKAMGPIYERVGPPLDILDARDALREAAR